MVLGERDKGGLTTADHLRDATKKMDFISREAAIETLDEWAAKADEGLIDDAEWKAFRIVEDALKDIPAADVVEVVRCKDCREYDTTGFDDTPGFGWCKCQRKHVQSCFYCAHGEKGENR